jgi:homoserine kinase
VTDFAVSAPASSANLGSGFDSVGIAIEIRMTARVRVLAAGAPAVWTYAGSCAPTHDGIRGCIEAGIARIAPAAPPLAVELENEIPLGSGLGSSAAAFAIGVAIGARLADDAPGDAELARAVAELEGHPDNALAAWYGGAVIASLGDDGLTSLRFPAPKAELAIVIPSVSLTTLDARALLPLTYSRADVVFNIQRAALLGAALASGDIAALGAAMRDRIHQPYRAPAIPGLSEVLEISDGCLLGIALSGAGPAVLALASHDAAQIGERIRAIFFASGLPATAMTPNFASGGVSVAVSEGV